MEEIKQRVATVTAFDLAVVIGTLSFLCLSYIPIDFVSRSLAFFLITPLSFLLIAFFVVRGHTINQKRSEGASRKILLSGFSEKMTEVRAEAMDDIESDTYTPALVERESESQLERRLHNDARRFARLLISEIKLYNEKKVIEGRQNNDIYSRLREAIKRSREVYDSQVAQSVKDKIDYFDLELKDNLAGGDVLKLGESFFEEHRSQK